MSTIAAIAAAATGVVLLIWIGLRMARKGGEKQGASDERAKSLVDSAERAAKAANAMAQPLPDRGRLVAAWKRYRGTRGLSDDKSG